MPLRRLEALTVCHHYSDFLAETLPHNLRHFDHYLIITGPDDPDTVNFCRKYGVDCRVTDLLHHDGDPFAKSRAIDYGLAYLRRDDWVLSLDADIWLPPMTRQWLTWATLDSQCIYGIDRCDCTGYDNWRNFIDRPIASHHQHTRGCLAIPPPFPLGARISLPQYGGYIPIGFFQLWNGRQFPDRRYPLQQGSAEHTDVLHALQWPASDRLLLPEIIAVHLASEQTPMGANWNGRTTRRFGPQPQSTPGQSPSTYHR